jgi:hypothetical protein
VSSEGDRNSATDSDSEKPFHSFLPRNSVIFWSGSTTVEAWLLLAARDAPAATTNN